MKYIGIDGCKGGWYCVGFDDRHRKQWQTVFATELTEVSAVLRRSELVLIDIPIGLRSIDTRERLCDLEARKQLQSPRSSCVFPAPCRRALKVNSYTEASAMNFGCTGRKLSKQTWNIMPKIREVDLYIRRRQLKGRIREMHPEIVFWALNKQQPVPHPKRTDEGYEARRALLEPYVPDIAELLFSAIENTSFGQGLIARDDVLDALAGAVAATFNGRLKTLPAIPETDIQGLPMEIVYPEV